MQQSLLLLSLAACVLSAAVAMPLSVEESAERGSSLESEMEMEKGVVENVESVESEEILKTGWDSSEGTVPKTVVKRSPEAAAKDASSSSSESSEELLKKKEQPAPAERKEDPPEAAAKDASSSSEEHGKDKAKATAKADSSGESSEELKKKEPQTEPEPETASRRRRQAIKDPHSIETVDDEADEDEDPLHLDSLAEKEDAGGAAAPAVIPPDNTSIEDYAQGCEVMEVSSKEANETTYVE